MRTARRIFDHQDWEGSERAVTSYNGGVEGSYTSLPYDDGYSVSGSDIDPYHFAMLDTDSSSDTNHAMFRQFGNTQGRWMSPDPYAGSYDINNPQSMNRYSYVLNLPLSYVDPFGLLFCEVVGDDTWSVTDNQGMTPTSGSDAGVVVCTDDGAGDGGGGYIDYVGSGGGGGGGWFGGAPGKLPIIDKKAMQSCLNSFYNSKAGKAINLFSAGSMIWGPDPFGHLIDNALEKGAEFLGVKAGNAAGAAAITTLGGPSSIASPVDTLVSKAADFTEAGAETVGIPVFAGATAIDIGAHLV